MGEQQAELVNRRPCNAHFVNITYRCCYCLPITLLEVIPSFVIYSQPTLAFKFPILLSFFFFIEVEMMVLLTSNQIMFCFHVKM